MSQRIGLWIAELLSYWSTLLYIGQDGPVKSNGARSGQIILVAGVVLAALGVLMFLLGANNVTPLNEGTLVIFGVLAVVLGFITALTGLVLMIVLGRRSAY